MRMDELEKGFWGYKKESVYNYIVSMEERTSQKLAEKDEELSQLENDSQQRITELESSLEAAQEEIERLRESQAPAFTTLLKDESVRREQKTQEELKMTVQLQTERVDVYSAKVHQLREAIRDMLREFESEADLMEQSAAALPPQAPNVSLGSLPAQPHAADQEGETWKRLPSM